MKAREAVANTLVPLGLAGVFWLASLPLSAVLALFAPYWGVLLLKAVDRRFHTRLPPSEGGYLSTRSHPLVLLGVLLWFGANQSVLDRPAFSFLLGVAFIDLWPLLVYLLAGLAWLAAKLVQRARPPDSPRYGGGEGISLVIFPLPLLVDLLVYALWIPAERVLSLPLAAGALLAVLVTFVTLAVQGERLVPPPQ